MRLLTALLGAMLSLASMAGQASAEKRVALVIGNSNYQKVPKLANPSSDAAAFATLLRSSGFSVVEARRDLSGGEMRRVIRDFSDQVRDADMAVVFYAGHGIEFDGTNYLLPVDAVLERDIDIEDETVSLDRIVRLLEPVKKLRLVILDACRDNPFAAKMKRTMASRSIGRGLAKVEPASSDTLIAFAAKAGSTASDGEGLHSPFTAALLKHIAEPGLDLRLALGRVRDDVLKATATKQEPFVYGSLGGATVSLVALPAKPVAATPATPPADPAAGIRRDYELAGQVGTKEAWDYFLAAHPAGFYSNLAKAQRDKIIAEEQRALKAAAQAKAAAEAKAASEAKAAADAKAAEARRAAEATAIAEAEAKRAAAAKASEEAKAAAAKAAKEKSAAEAEVKRATEAKTKADADKAKADANVSTKVAGLSPEPRTTPAPATMPDPGETTRKLQAELRRVGCYPGAVNGNWDNSSRGALELFNKHAGMRLDVKLASLDSVDVLKGKSGRVCPLQCERGFRADKDVCIRITCPRGQVLKADGDGCERREQPRTAAKPGADKEAPAKPAAGGGSGQIVCNYTGCQTVKPGCRVVPAPHVNYSPSIICN